MALGSLVSLFSQWTNHLHLRFSTCGNGALGLLLNFIEMSHSSASGSVYPQSASVNSSCIILLYFNFFSFLLWSAGAHESSCWVFLSYTIIIRMPALLSMSLPLDYFGCCLVRNYEFVHLVLFISWWCWSSSSWLGKSWLWSAHSSVSSIWNISHCLIWKIFKNLKNL